MNKPKKYVKIANRLTYKALIIELSLKRCKVPLVILFNGPSGLLYKAINYMTLIMLVLALSRQVLPI
jgi:hypothetical protein